ncbi:hypothetical protein ABPG72_008384 [Tetrahymena utriculariae]
MRDFSKGYKILVFSFKIILGILDKISNIVYFCYEPFKFYQIRDAMLFFILLSPIIQSVAWSILLAQMQVDIPKPLKMNRVKQSTSIFSFICNLLISVVEYNVKILFEIIKYLPQSVMITLLQEIKIFPFCLFGYTYFKYQAILTRDLMKNLAPHLFLFQQIEDEEEKEKKLMKDNNKNQIVELKHEQISPKMVSKSINKSISSISNISPESSSSPRKIINLKQAFQQDEKPGSQQIPININLDLKNKSSSQRIDSELDDSKHLHNPFLPKSPANNDQLYQKYFNQNIFQTKKLLNQNFPLKKSHESFDLQNAFGNSVLLMQNQQRKESFNSPTRKKNHHQQVAQNSDVFDEDNMHQMRRRATSIKKKGFDKSIQNITHLLKYNNQQQQQLIHHQQQVQQQEVTRKRGFSTVKKDNLIHINNVAPHQQIQQAIPQNDYENGQDTNDKVFNETDLLLDANIQPTIDTLIQDHNLEQFLLITDVIEAMFEALPMTIIQFINNGINDSWKLSNGTQNLFIYFSFFTSLITIILHGISLINILYDENIKIFYFTLQFLQKFQMNNNDDKSYTYESDSTDKNKQNSDQQNDNNKEIDEQKEKSENLKGIKKKNSKKKAEGFGRIFPMRSEVKLDNLMQLNKLSILRQQASEEIKSLQLLYNGYRYQSQKIINTIAKALDKIKFLNKLIIEFDDNFYQKDISPLITKILTEQNNLNNLQISYYGNEMSKDEAYNIYRMINSWHLKIRDAAEDILFQNNSIFIWRCYKLKHMYPNDIYEIFQDRFETLFDTSPQEKYIVEIVLPEKEFSEEECEEFLQSIVEWENLQHLQLLYRSMPRKYENQMNYYASNAQNLKSCLLVSGKNGLICNKGYTLQISKDKNQLEIENHSFIFNYDALKFIFDKNINLIQKLQLEEINLNFENQNENENCFKEYHVQSLLKFVQEYKGLISLNLNLKNNNIAPLTAESIGQCIDSLSSLIDIELNFSDNRFGAVGVNNIFKFFDKNSRKFRKISINLCRNLIQNEGVGHLIQFLNNQTQKLTILEVQKLNNNIGIGQSFIEQKKDIFLENLILDLSNNRFKSDLLDHLLKVISSFVHIKYLELKLNGNIIEIQTEFNFSLLKELNKLGLTFWCNNFSDQSLCNLFKSMKSIKQLEELSFEVVSNNMSDKIQQFQGHLDHLNSLKKLELVYSKNGKNLTRFKDFDLTLLEIRHLEEFTVDLSNCNFSLFGVKELVKNLYFLSSILKIDLNFSENVDFNDQCTNAILESISSLPQLKILVLNFQKTSITDRTVESIFKKIVDMTTLRSVTVDFIDNKTTESAMKYIVDGLLKSNHIQNPQFRI